MIADFVKIHGLGKIQDLLTLEMELTQAGYTMDDLMDFVETKRRLLRKKEQIRTPSKVCGCGAQMLLYQVNTAPGNQTGDDSKHVWFCPVCLSQEFTPKTFNQIIKESISGDASKQAPREGE